MRRWRVFRCTFSSTKVCGFEKTYPIWLISDTDVEECDATMLNSVATAGFKKCMCQPLNARSLLLLLCVGKTQGTILGHAVKMPFWCSCGVTKKINVFIYHQALWITI
jgi:hypothetical protein